VLRVCLPTPSTGGAAGCAGHGAGYTHSPPALGPLSGGHVGWVSAPYTLSTTAELFAPSAVTRSLDECIDSRRIDTTSLDAVSVKKDGMPGMPGNPRAAVCRLESSCGGGCLGVAVHTHLEAR
jgi:hypothetical protein